MAYSKQTWANGRAGNTPITAATLGHIEDGLEAAAAVADAAQPGDADLTTIAALDPSTAGVLSSDGAGWIRKSYSAVKTALALVKGDVGLGDVDNTSDANKPISTATQTALDAKLAISTAAGTYAPLVRATTVAYAATVTPNADTTDVLNIGALTGNLTLAAPTGTPRDGQSLMLRLAQDATGSRTITFNAAYAFGTDVTTALVPTAASSKWTMMFVWNASDSKWRALAIARGF